MVYGGLEQYGIGGLNLYSGRNLKGREHTTPAVPAACIALVSSCLADL